MSAEFTTPVGRLVGGHPMVSHIVKDNKKEYIRLIAIKMLYPHRWQNLFIDIITTPFLVLYGNVNQTKSTVGYLVHQLFASTINISVS